MAHIHSGEEEASPPPVQSATTRLRGLPYSATDEDLIAFFEDFEVVSTHICKRSGARPAAPARLRARAAGPPCGRRASLGALAQGGRAARRMCSLHRRRRRSGRSRRRTTRTWASDTLSAPPPRSTAGPQGRALDVAQAAGL